MSNLLTPYKQERQNVFKQQNTFGSVPNLWKSMRSLKHCPLL